MSELIGNVGFLCFGLATLCVSVALVMSIFGAEKAKTKMAEVVMAKMGSVLFILCLIAVVLIIVGAVAVSGGFLISLL